MTMTNWIDRWKKFSAGLAALFGNKRVRRIGILILGTLLLLTALFFSLRDPLLRHLVNRKITAFQNSHPGTVVQIANARFRGLSGIVCKTIHLHTPGDTLTIGLGSCTLRFRFLKLLTGRLEAHHLGITDLYIGLNDANQPARSATGRTQRSGNRPSGYGRQASELINLFFRRLPASLTIDRLAVESDLNQIHQSFRVLRLAITGPAFTTPVQVESLRERRQWRLVGTIERKARRLSVRLSSDRPGETVALPFIDRQWGLHIGFTSAFFSLKSGGWRDELLHLDGSMAIWGLTFNHPRIATGDVHLANAALTYSLDIGPDFLDLVKPTRVAFNRFSFSPRIRLKPGPAGQLAVKIEPAEFAADDFFRSLPAGLFTRLAGIRTSGTLAYGLNFFIDFTRPDDLVLESNLKTSQFRIRRFGAVDFRDVNAPFLHTVYEKDQAVRLLLVGPEDPEFRTLDQISPYLQSAVMISEDGAFFNHRGFLLEPFKKSIAANWKQGRFVRGASTISMQLVKNLYLKRHKTIARKLEEMIITWLIEENRLIPKERMFEIYLNIIEWGSMIYGIQEASRFYFGKDAADLTLAESIFLASIIPRPKRFTISFDRQGKLQPWLQNYYRNVSEKMLLRGWITQADFDTLVPDIQLQGPARFLLKGYEPVPEEPIDEETDV